MLGIWKIGRRRRKGELITEIRVQFEKHEELLASISNI
jgi:hypothetical protein